MTRSEDSLRQVASSLFEAMNSRDFATFEQHITDDVSFDFPGTTVAEGKRRTLLLIRSILRKFPELHFTVTGLLAEGDRACAVWTNRGVDLKGEPYRNSGITYFQFRDEKICFISDYFKDTSFIES